MRDAAFGCYWVGTAINIQRCLIFIIAAANKELQLTAGKFVPVSNVTMMNVCIYIIMSAYLRQEVIIHYILYNCKRKEIGLPHKKGAQ